MASSTMAALPMPSPAPKPESLSPRLPPVHARKHSRNPSAVALPTFVFNPGSTEQATPTADVENQPPADITTASGHIRRSSKPPPLPEFKFNPGAELPSPATPSPTHPVLEEMALNQQRVSRSARPAPLPMFTFNPGAGGAQSIPSPTRSEAGDVDGQRHLGGHRRGGSEFVGGGLESAQVVNTSPQKHESKPSGPPVSNSGFRGHNHRRSQAISVSDIDTSELIKAHAVAKSRAGSGPSTPSDNNQSFYFPRPSPQLRPTPMNSQLSPPSSPRRRESAPGARSRIVDFAEKIDVIPRPLSMISSETEGSCSTVRGGHSLSNSINSLASPPRASPPTISSPVLDGSPRRRPRTADPSILMAVGASAESDAALSIPKRPLSASGSPATASDENPPLKKKHFWSSHSNEATPTPTPKAEVTNPFENFSTLCRTFDADKPRPKTSPERTLAPIKRKKYHTWTAGIFSKKSRHRSSKMKGKRTPTPPALSRRDSEKLNEIFDADDTIVLREDSPVHQRTQPLVYTSNWNEPPSTPKLEEVTSPVIDLDAALGPFGSDEHLSLSSNRTAASRIAKLHSSERRGVVDAFGVFHRRTESAPSMPVVNRSFFGTQRYGDSNASLAQDVFDEEEEDIFLADQEKAKSDDDDDNDEDEEAAEKPEDKPKTPVDTVVDRTSGNGLGLTNVHDASDSVIIFDPETGIASEDNRSSKSTIEAPVLLDDDMPKRPSTSPMPLAYPATQFHYASSTEGRTTTTASLISSPDPDYLSFDNHPRLRRFGDGSPDFVIRPSTDDLPSLSDSISSGVVPRISSSANTRSSTERSHSMFVPSTSKSHQNWKRSSLASLNKLIQVGSANGSKLKFETVPDASGNEEPTKKKSNRISRLMKFWRSKETD